MSLPAMRLNPCSAFVAQPNWRCTRTITIMNISQTAKCIDTLRPAPMLDDFLIRAYLAGIGIALVAGPLGCFVIWRKMAYFGDTLSHGALLGVSLGLLFQIDLTVSVFGLSAALAASLVLLKRRADLSTDALLGILSHGALAIGLVALSFMSWIRVDLMGLLFGDILAIAPSDLLMIWSGACLVLGLLWMIWKPLFASTVHPELAEAEGLHPARVETLYMLMMAAVIAIAIQLVGVLLITALLIIPAAGARRLAQGPVQMMVIASAIGTLSVVVGLTTSLFADTPTGPSIVVAALICFLMSLSPLSAALSGRK